MKTNSFPGFGALIKKYRARAELSQSGLADALGVSRNTILNWETEKCQPDMFYIKALCEELCIPITEFFKMETPNGLTFEERRVINLFRELSSPGKEIAKKTLFSIKEVEDNRKIVEMKDSFKYLQFPSTASAAGNGCQFGDVPPETRFVRKTNANARADAMIRIDGRSMEPVYHSGDLVYVEYTQDVHPNDVVICSTADGAVIKCVSEDRQLFSLNPDYPYGMKSEDDNVRVIGKVLGIVQEDDLPVEEDCNLLEEIFVDELREYRQEHGC